MHDQSMNQLSKVNNYTGCVSANARPHRLCRVIVKMGTAISFINVVSGWPYSYCRYMQKLLKHNFLCRCASKIIATIQAIIIFMCVLFDVCIHVYMHNVCTILARYYAPFVYKPPLPFCTNSLRRYIYLQFKPPPCPDHGRTLRL